MPGRRRPGPAPGPKPGPGGGGRRARRTSRRRRRRRIVVVGGAVVLAGSAVSHKMSTKDADRVEQHTGQSVEELTDEELTQAMTDLGIEEMPLTEEDQAAIDEAGEVSSVHHKTSVVFRRRAVKFFAPNLRGLG